MTGDVVSSNEPDSLPLAEQEVATDRIAPAPATPSTGRWIRLAWGGIKLLIGMGLSQLFVGSVLVLGWGYRVMQRTTRYRWWQLAQVSGVNSSFREFAAQGTHTHEMLDWPNWILGLKSHSRVSNPEGGTLATRIRRLVGRMVGSLWLNLRWGIQGILTTWTLTMPCCLLWLFAWYDGWNNSYNKGYEQAAVGPVVFILGIILFVAAMFYVPMAQARFASTGNWRSFFQFRFVWRLVRQEWLACVFLAGFYAAIALPVNILKTMPEFFPQMRPEFETYTAAQAIDVLNTYFFWSALFLFPAFVFLKWFAARVYAAGIVRGLRRGRIVEEDLAVNEWETLHRLQLVTAPEGRSHHVLVKMLAWVATGAGRITAGVMIAGFWLSFVFLILISEFFMFHPFVGWLNQPMVQLPWFRYLP